MGQYSIIVEKTAQKELQAHYKSGDKPLIKKIEKIFEELVVHPETGEGKPEPLKHQLSGMWSRRINREHRIVYEIIENSVFVHSAKGHYD
jgi:toxin YoeB